MQVLAVVMRLLWWTPPHYRLRNVTLSPSLRTGRKWELNSKPKILNAPQPAHGDHGCLALSLEETVEPVFCEYFFKCNLNAMTIEHFL
jgi:hypothetical protein